MSKQEIKPSQSGLSPLPADIAALYEPRPMRKLSEAEALRMLTEKRVMFYQALDRIEEKRIAGLKKLEEVIFTK